MPALRFPTVLFDWGDTVMYDDPTATVPMVEWEQVHPVEDVDQVLTYLQSSGRRCILATSADVSSESQIRGALARAGLDHYFSRIYSFTNTGLPKGETFYRHILQDLALPAQEALMVGDSFQKDVLIPNSLGIYGVWFSPADAARSRSDLHTTVRTMQELLSFWRSLDGRERD